MRQIPLLSSWPQVKIKKRHYRGQKPEKSIFTHSMTEYRTNKYVYSKSPVAAINLTVCFVSCSVKLIQ